MKWTIILLLIFLIQSTNANLQFVINTWPFTQATEKAWQTLSTTDDALLAVEQGCTECEKDRCDGTVGFGGSPDENGESVLDALIMDGVTHRAGSVAGLRRVKNAIGVARAVMTYTKHTLLVGDLATQFAIEMGFKEEDLHSNESINQWIEWKNDKCQPNFRVNVKPDPAESCGPYKPDISRKIDMKYQQGLKTKIGKGWHDTIGMIAVDSNGDIAVGTSSNGATFKVPG